MSDKIQEAVDFAAFMIVQDFLYRVGPRPKVDTIRSALKKRYGNTIAQKAMCKLRSGGWIRR